MRVVEEIPHPACKITIFQWNGKFMVKFETATLEQTYKISEQDVNLGELKKMLNNAFITKVYQRFLDMGRDMNEEFQSKNINIDEK